MHCQYFRRVAPRFRLLLAKRGVSGLSLRPLWTRPPIRFANARFASYIFFIRASPGRKNRFLQKLIVRPWSHLHSEYRCPNKLLLASSHHLPPATHEIPGFQFLASYIVSTCPCTTARRAGIKVANYSRVMRLSLGRMPIFSRLRAVHSDSISTTPSVPVK